MNCVKLSGVCANGIFEAGAGDDVQKRLCSSLETASRIKSCKAELPTRPAPRMASTYRHGTQRMPRNRPAVRRVAKEAVRMVALLDLELTARLATQLAATHASNAPPRYRAGRWAALEVTEAVRKEKKG